MSIVRWDPFRELAGMQEQMNRLYSDAYSRRGDDDLMARGDWIPPVDIYQSGDGVLVITAEVPGIAREDIDVRVENDTLTIHGERKHTADVKSDQYHRVERSYGSFSRSFSLPASVDGAKVSAEYKDGLLSVTLPMKEEAKPRQIKVAVN